MHVLSTIIFSLIILSVPVQLFSAEIQKFDRIRIGYSSISSSRIALWATSDMGFFKKQGLAAEVIVTPGIQGTQALIAGELQFYLGGVDSAALAASRGSDLVALATAEPIEYKLIAQPGINTVKDLKGKKVVVDRVGDTSYYVSLQILEKGRIEARRHRSNAGRRRGIKEWRRSSPVSSLLSSPPPIDSNN